MTAQLTIEPAPQFGKVARLYSVSCGHGATHMLLAGNHSPTREHERHMLHDLMDHHHKSWRCTCTTELRQRYLDGEGAR